LGDGARTPDLAMRNVGLRGFSINQIRNG
jgi:hypothetical protein